MESKKAVKQNMAQDAEIRQLKQKILPLQKSSQKELKRFNKLKPEIETTQQELQNKQ